MARFHVVRVEVEGYEHLRAFDDLSTSLVAGLVAMGHAATAGAAAETDPSVVNIVLGAHVLDDSALASLPPGTVVYNHEQVDVTSLLSPQRLSAFAPFEVWDYSARNVGAWAAAGVAASHVPVGWADVPTTIRRDLPQPIDVLFYGSVNDRRRRILDALGRAGLEVHLAFGVYGAERDDLISASKLVLNVNFYERRILETVRLAHLLAQDVPVVSERTVGLEMPAGFDRAARFASYDRLVDAVRELVEDPHARVTQGRRGRDVMRAWPWSRSLSGLVDADGLVERPQERGIRLVVGTTARRTPCVGIDAVVTRANAELLALAGAGPEDVGPPPLLDANHPEVVRIVEEAVAELRAMPSDGVVGDPLVAWFLAVWAEAFERADLDVSVTLVVDDPQVAAVELARERSIDVDRALMMWVRQLVFSEALTRDPDRAIEVRGGPAAEGAAAGGARRGQSWELARALADAVRRGADAEVDQLATPYLEALGLFGPVLDTT